MKKNNLPNLPLTADMVEVRIGNLQSTKYGYYGNLLLYQESRASMNALDTLYPNWQRTHQEIGGLIFCTISVFDEDKQKWIERQDVGTAGDFEKEKSQVSDSFKRAAVNFIPAFRALYKAPKIRIKLNDNEAYVGDNGKVKCYTKFSVSELAFDEAKQCFTSLVITDDKGNVRFDIKNPVGKVMPNEPEQTSRETVPQQKNVKPVLPPTANTAYVCSECGKAISPKVSAYSISKFKKQLCMDCQRQSKAA